MGVVSAHTDCASLPLNANEKQGHCAPKEELLCSIRRIQGSSSEVRVLVHGPSHSDTPHVCTGREDP